MRKHLSTYLIFATMISVPLFYARHAHANDPGVLDTGCARDFARLSPHLGHELTKHQISELEFQDSGARYFELGSGKSGATVYRVVSRAKSNSYGLKQYMDPKRLTEDLLGFESLRESMKGRDLPIEIVSAKRIGSRSMRLPEILGKNLERVLNEDEISDAEKAQLKKSWNTFVRHIEQSIPKNERYDAELVDHGGVLSLMFETIRDGRTITIWLKPDNVIVEAETGRLVLVDPL